MACVYDTKSARRRAILNELAINLAGGLGTAALIILLSVAFVVAVP